MQPMQQVYIPRKNGQQTLATILEEKGGRVLAFWTEGGIDHRKWVNRAECRKEQVSSETGRLTATIYHDPSQNMAHILTMWVYDSGKHTPRSSEVVSFIGSGLPGIIDYYVTRLGEAHVRAYQCELIR